MLWGGGRVPSFSPFRLPPNALYSVLVVVVVVVVAVVVVVVVVIIIIALLLCTVVMRLAENKAILEMTMLLCSQVTLYKHISVSLSQLSTSPNDAFRSGREPCRKQGQRSSMS